MTKVIKIPTSKITQFELKQIPTIEQGKKTLSKKIILVQLFLVMHLEI